MPPLVCLHLDPMGDAAAELPQWWRVLPETQAVLARPLGEPAQPSGDEAVADRVVAVPAAAGMVAVLAAVHARFPDRDIAYIRAGAAPPADWVALLAEAARTDPRVGAVFPLSDFLAAFSPCAAGGTDGLAPRLVQRWVAHCARGLVFEVPVLLPICGWFRAPALAALAQAGELSDAGDPAARFRARGWSCVACDRVFVGAPAPGPEAVPAPSGPDLEVFLASHPLAELRVILAREMTGPDAAPPPAPAAKPVQLHITHSWGGGVGRWVQDMCEADPGRSSLVLRSLGNVSAYAYRLALYRDGESLMPLREWRLDFPICSTAAAHYHYRAVLAEVVRDFQVDLIIVSSLIGHSLDALDSGLPTLVVQHDFFPFCPALSIRFREVCTGCDRARLRSCFAENPLNHLFANTDTEHWLTLRRRWLELLQRPEIRLAAPSGAVLRHLRALAPEIAALPAAVVPNGSRSLPLLRGDPGSGRLRLVVLGSLARQKGADILREALPDLLEFADLYLLGCGSEGAPFEGIAGVQVTRAYDLAELPALVAAIAPHAGLLLSIVPETFSYTLSELWQLGIPPVATRLGAFAERIADGRTGWLTEPSAPSLLALLRELDGHRERLAAVRGALAALPGWSREQMVQAYHALIPELSAKGAAGAPAVRDGRDGRIERLAEMVAERDAWSAHLEEGIARRNGRIDQLANEVAETSRENAKLEQDLRETSDRVVERDARISALTRSVAERDESLAAMYRSRSWRVTAPLRRLAARIKRVLIPVLKEGKTLYLKLPFSAETLSRHRRLLLDRAPWLLRLAGSRAVSAPPAAGAITAPTAPEAPEWYAAEAETPRVSIVVVAFNKSEFTIECLRSLWMHTAGVTYEVILVDNGSEPAHVAQVKPYLGPATPLELGANRGFGEGNNIGVEHARGEFVLLLNNDVTVTPGWLQPLVAVMDTRADAGAVGARLVYPDGVLQEAGACLRADGTAQQRGKGEPASSAGYGELAVVDYCSAAAVLVRRAIFLRVLGFDLCYDPAYYEDSDLCLKIEALGWRTYYCPETTVFHHEGATSRDASLKQGLHNVVEVNRQKFLARWEQRLRDGPPAELRPAPEPAAAPLPGALPPDPAARAPALRVGLYTPYGLLPGGGERYLLGIAAALRGIADVELVAPHSWSGLRLQTVARELALEIGAVRAVTVATARRREPYDVFVAMGNEIVPPVAALGKRNIFHCQFPFAVDRRTFLERRAWLDGYGSIIVNSGFTRNHVCRQLARHGLDTAIPVEVISPPVALLTPAADKAPIILNVGRFFSGGHNKKQLEMVRAFKRIWASGRAAGWELHLAGAAHPEPEHREHLLRIIAEAQGCPIRIHVNPPLPLLRRLYGEASLYWHATGFDVDEDRFPEQHEHFGITTVEAMSAGCVPIVVATAGQREIVREGENGMLWRSLPELENRTVQAIAHFDTEEMRTLRANAVRRAGEFGGERFAAHIRRHLGLE